MVLITSFLPLSSLRSRSGAANGRKGLKRKFQAVVFLVLCARGLELQAQDSQAAGPYQWRSSGEGVPHDANPGHWWMEPDKETVAAADGPLPLLVYLHGGGAKGEGTDRPLTEPLPSLLATDKMRRRFPCFVLVPQCRSGRRQDGRPRNWVQWNNQADGKPETWTVADDAISEQLLAVKVLIDHVLGDGRVDPARVYLTGVSMGGSGSWNLASRHPGTFTALVTVCGLSEVKRARTLAKLPVWTFHGAQDDQVPVRRTRDLVNALKAVHAPVTYTEYPDEGHGIARRVFTDDDHVVLRWLFEQRKP